MKKILTILAASAVAITATADISGFYFKQKADLTDQTGAVIDTSVTGNINLLSLYDVDGVLDTVWATAQTSGSIDIAVLQGFLEVASSSLTSTSKAGYTQNQQTDGDASTIGLYAFGLVSADFASIADATVGNYFGLTAVAGPLTDLQPNTSLPAGAADALEGGAIQTNIQVVGIPEPATLGLMGIAGLGMFLARKKARR